MRRSRSVRTCPTDPQLEPTTPPPPLLRCPHIAPHILPSLQEAPPALLVLLVLLVLRLRQRQRRAALRLLRAEERPQALAQELRRA